MTYFSSMTTYLDAHQLRVANQNDSILQLQIRVNGYLKDIIYLSPHGEKTMVLHHLRPKHTVTVHEVEEDINLMIPENATYYNPDFFKTLAEDDVIEWRYDDGTLEADKVTTFERPLEPWEEDN